MQRRGQGFSIDLLFAVVIFILIITLFYSLLSDSKDNDTSGLQYEADVLSAQLSDESSTNEKYVVVVKGEINSLAIAKLYDDISNDYDDVREELNIQGDFCIFLEDEEGKLIPIGNKTSAGSPDLSLGEYDCNEVIP